MRRILLLAPIILAITIAAILGGRISTAHANICDLTANKPSLSADHTDLFGNFTVTGCNGRQWNVQGWVESYKPTGWSQVQYSRQFNITRNNDQSVAALVLSTFVCTPGRVYRTYAVFGDGTKADYSGGQILC